MKNYFLGLIAKYPEPGKVKTRLARDIGAGEAAKIYRVVAEGVFRKTRPVDAEFERVVFYSPSDSGPKFERWLPGERLLPQTVGDIGEIMGAAIQELLRLGASKAVIAGVDIPDLGREIVREAFLKLDCADVVIGPAMDGGYYLIGMKAFYPECFQNISWSTETVFDETLRAIKKLGLEHATLDELSDVDRVGDVAKLSL